METYTLLVFGLTLLGFVVIASELFIPSAGMLSLLATGCFVAAAWCAWRGWYEPGRVVLFWSYIFGMVLLLPTFIAGGLYILPRTTYGRSIFATPQALEDVTPFKEEEQRLRSLLNQEGRALTFFSPGGMAEVDGERFHAESDGLMIDAGARIQVVGLRGNRLLVRQMTEPLADSNRSNATPSVDGGDVFGFDAAPKGSV